MTRRYIEAGEPTDGTDDLDVFYSLQASEIAMGLVSSMKLNDLDWADAMCVLERSVALVIAALVPAGRDEHLIASMGDAILKNLPRLRLLATPAAGSA